MKLGKLQEQGVKLAKREDNPGNYISQIWRMMPSNELHSYGRTIVA